MKRISYPARGKYAREGLHVEAPGCIVNIRAGLSSMDGSQVTSVQIICDQYAGEPAWSLLDYDKARSMNVRVVREDERAHRIKQLQARIARYEITEANGAEPQKDENGNTRVQIASCGTCGQVWNDALMSARTPAPSARCPYEAIHEEIAELRSLGALPFPHPETACVRCGVPKALHLTTNNDGSVTDALQLLKKCEGYQGPPAPTVAERKPGRLWIVVHHHRHGEDVFPIYATHEPTERQQIALIEEGGSSFEPENGEHIEVRGPFTPWQSLLPAPVQELDSKAKPQPDTDSTTVRLDRAELATVLASLRYYQQKGLGDPANRPLEIHDIATDGDSIASSLDDEAIDALCERLNCGEEASDAGTV